MLNKILEQHSFHRMFDFSLSPDNTLVLDLSKDNNEPAFLRVDTCEILQQYIDDKLTATDKQYGFGGYLENRAIYERFTHFNDSSTVERYIHLGIDVWCDALEPVYAPADAVVHSVAINDNEGDYGGTIILRHAIGEEVFHTLYGHMSHSSVRNLSENREIKAGEQIGWIGKAEENGGWPPHLHFQVIKDLEGYSGDYPGVTSKDMVARMKSNCPDPNLILKTPLNNLY